MKLNEEEREQLEELLEGYGWPVLLKSIEELVSRRAQKILRYNTSEGTDGLVRVKNQYDGASQLLLDIRNIKKIARGE